MTVWTEHVTAALLGTQRRRPPRLPGIPETAEDPAARLLDQAGLLAVQKRAGRKPAAAEPIAPAPAESRRPVPSAAARRLEQILLGDKSRMLPEWLGAAADRGFRVPARNLPDLLDKGRSDRSIRPYIARAAGRRGAWLALQNPDWAYLLTESEASVDEVADWETGTRGQRVAFLTSLRLRDAAAARALLGQGWAKETAPDRAAFLATFEHGLSGADEEFLESALDDRGKDVRQLAADLLSLLPGSRYAARMAGRARGLIRPEQRTVRLRSQTWVWVSPPEDHDDEMARDGIPFHPAGSFAPGDQRVGTRAAWLREILARTPLATWTELFGLPAMEVVCLPVIDDFARDVHLGWARAALRQRNAEWARALLKGGVVIEESEALADLLQVLPDGEREAAAADLIHWAEGHADLMRVLGRIPGPWTGRLADAVLAALAGALRNSEDSRHVAQLCKLADERLGPETAPRLDELTSKYDTWPLAELAETLRFRHEMLQELL
jgi:hypothetical protein